MCLIWRRADSIAAGFVACPDTNETSLRRFGFRLTSVIWQCKKWRLQLKREMRDLDRQITGIDREEKKVKAEAKKAAKDGQLESGTSVCTLLATSGTDIAFRAASKIPREADCAVAKGQGEDFMHKGQHQLDGDAARKSTSHAAGSWSVGKELGAHVHDE